MFLSRPLDNRLILISEDLGGKRCKIENNIRTCRNIPCLIDIWLGGRILIRAILFDLDGTLTQMDQDKFMRNYLGLLAPRFAHLLPTDKFAKYVLKSTEVMMKDPKQGKTNLQNFFDDFTKTTGLSFNVLWPIFEEYYQQDFPALRLLVEVNQDGRKAVEQAIQQGYVTAIAANPVMPLRAIQERIRWAELSPDQFTLVPALEDFHFCKPHLGFYAEISERLGLSPEECLMVGNHPQEDMVARELGMKTFMVSRDGINTDNSAVADYSGDLPYLNQLILRGNL